VRAALLLKGIAFETQAVHLVKNGGEQFAPAYTALNPMAEVPTLVIDGHTLNQVRRWPLLLSAVLCCCQRYYQPPTAGHCHPRAAPTAGHWQPPHAAPTAGHWQPYAAPGAPVAIAIASHTMY
jgi:hypothetical protein